MVRSDGKYNILGFFPVPVKSHFYAFSPIVKELANRGHDVTVLSYFPLQKPLNNYKDISLGNYEMFYNNSFSKYFLSLKYLPAKSRVAKYLNPLFLTLTGSIICEYILSSPGLKELFKSNQTFDLVILEQFNVECFTAITNKLGAPVVKISSSTLLPWNSVRYGLPNHPAYIPNNMLSSSDRMSFFERVECTIFTFLHIIFFQYISLLNDKIKATKYLGDYGSTISYDIMNESLLLTNSHYTLNLPKPVVPNIIEIGGIHIGKNLPLKKVSSSCRNSSYYW